MPSAQSTRHGWTIIEVLSLMVVGTVAMVVSVAVAQATANQDRMAIDAAQQRALGQGMTAYAETNSAKFPAPGLRVRQPVRLGDGTAVRLIGKGKPEWTLNTTANLFSMMIMERLAEPETVISPLEVSQLVRARTDYNFAAYDPFGDPPLAWDPAFAQNPGDVTVESNASYATQALCGRRFVLKWNSNAGSNWPILTLRGPQNGATEGDAFTRSPTLGFMGTPQSWDANVLFCDLSLRAVDSTVVDGTNLFQGDDPKGDSAWMGVFIAIRQSDATPGWDPLIPDSPQDRTLIRPKGATIQNKQ